MSEALPELLRGKGAHVDPIASIEDVSHEMANRKPEGFTHSIAELVFHMNYWMEYELHRIRAEKPRYPEHNTESFPQSPVGAGEWESMKQDFVASLQELARLAQFPRHELDRPVESVHDGDKKLAGTLESVLWQMVVHNSYHIGQIAQLRRALNAWPPPSGGDTW